MGSLVVTEGVQEGRYDAPLTALAPDQDLLLESTPVAFPVGCRLLPTSPYRSSP